LLWYLFFLENFAEGSVSAEKKYKIATNIVISSHEPKFDRLMLAPQYRKN